MYYRRKILLNFIAAFGNKGVEKIKLQKLLFLFCQEQEQPIFDFVPYQYGCFSFQANKDLHVLHNHYQLISLIETKWFINQPADIELKDREKAILEQILRRFAEHSKDRIISYVYDFFPYFSVNSQWSMTTGQQRQRDKERQDILSAGQSALFTIGYEGKSIDFYLNQLVKHNIRLLCDVRKNPISMKYGFSKKQLKTYCENLTIHYEHIPELGIVSEKRRTLNSQNDYRVLFAEYRKALPAQREGLEKVSELLREHGRIALTCFEKDPCCCHRKCISDYLHENSEIRCEHL